MPVLAPDPAWDELERVLEEMDVAGELEAYLAARPPEVAIILERLQAERGCGWRGHPSAMAAHLLDDFERFRYTELLSRKFREAADGVSRRQIWNIPARYGKSTIASQWGPIWLLARNPRARIILTSYGDTLALENAHAVRDALNLYRDRLGVTLRRDRRRIDRFVTAEGGGILARGIGSGISGFGAGRGGGIVIDDPFKNWQEAMSPTVREAVWRAWQGVLRIRLDDESAFVIVVHTRWHDDDLTGRLLAEEPHEDGTRWELIRLAAQAEAHDPEAHDPLLRTPDPLGRRPGEVLEPRRFSAAEVRSRAQDLGSWLAAALEQQRPAPEEGGELKRAWWRWETELPPRFDTAAASWDMKLKEKDTGDYIAGQVWGRVGADYFLRAALRGRWNVPTVKAAIALFAVRFPDVSRHYVENTGNGPEVMAELRRGMGKGYKLSDEVAGAIGCTLAERPAVERVLRRGLAGIIPVNPKGSKEARVRAIAGRVEAGNVHLLERMPGAVQLVNEAAAFPNAEHDDTVDAMTQALFKLGNIRAGGATSRTRRRITPAAPTATTPGPDAPLRRRRARRRLPS